MMTGISPSLGSVLIDRQAEVFLESEEYEWSDV